MACSEILYPVTSRDEESEILSSRLHTPHVAWPGASERGAARSGGGASSGEDRGVGDTEGEDEEDDDDQAVRATSRWVLQYQE